MPIAVESRDWSAKAGLFPFNPDKALRDIPRLAAELAERSDDQAGANGSNVTPDGAASLQSPVTPVLVGAVAALHDLIREDADALEESSKQRLQKHLQKLTNATQLSFAERTLLSEHNRFLGRINNEAKVRRATKSKILGTARVMSYEDIEQARTARATKDAKKEALSKAREAKQAEEDSGTAQSAKEGGTNRRKRGGKYMSNVEGDVAELEANNVHGTLTEGEETNLPSTSWQAPIAKMW